LQKDLPTRSTLANLLGSNVQLWLAGGLIALSLLWLTIIIDIDRDHQLFVKQGEAEAASLASNYAKQIDYLFLQIDQLSLFLTAAATGPNPADSLKKLFDTVPKESPMNLLYADEKGIVRSSRSKAALNADVSQMPYFVGHRNSESLKLKIQKPAPGVGSLSAKTVIRFSRRINKKDGSFGGVISIALIQDELTHFITGSSLEANDVVGMKFGNGEWLSYQTIESATHQAPKLEPLSIGSSHDLESNMVVNNKLSVFSSVSLAHYPLLTFVSITHDNILQPYQETERAYKLTLASGTALILFTCLIGIWFQIKRDQEKNYEEGVQNTFRLAVDGAQEELYMLSQFINPAAGQVDFKIEDCNGQAVRLSGGRRSDLISNSISELMDEANFDFTRLFLLGAMANGFAETEVQFYRPGVKEVRWYHCRAVRADMGLAVTLRDIHEVKEKEQQLQALAMTDSLTQLPNRHWMNQQLPEIIRKATSSNQKFGVMFIDLDNFKNINDTLGHQEGDRCLIDIAQALRESIRKQDYVIRLGGDEFMVLLLSLEDTSVVCEIASHLLASLRSAGEGSEWSTMRTRASIGGAIFPDDATTAESLIQAADIAMYEAKRAGKDRFTRYTNAMHDHLSDRVTLETALQQAVPENQLMLYLQPRVDAFNGNLCGFEALLRWQHPVMGLISPDRFIPLAEETNLIVDIGNWVANSTCELIARWMNEGRSIQPISINVSAKQLKDRSFRESLERSMQRYGISSSQIAIELTESSMVGDDKTTQEELRMLEGMGLKLMIDDFGTGYSSLSHLQKLNVDVLKIDKSFVQALSSQDQSEPLCQAMIQIGKTLGMAVVAEGVETKEQLVALQAMGCDEIQGFLIAAPLPIPEAEELLTHGPFFKPVQLSASASSRLNAA
jgi:diguanylate cyclase (GGDEF)-like protein